jgi:1-acyl-sn-glycerol-3-phosphate acyltransferase
MSPLCLLALASAFLVGPWILMPRRRRAVEYRGLSRVLWTINRLICAFWYRLDLEDGEMAPLPESGPAILISNHTCPIDPMLLQAKCRRRLGFMIAEEYIDFWLCRPFCRILGCIPVRRDGRDLAASRAALRALKEGGIVPIFPEGRIVPTAGRELAEPRPGVAFLVRHARVPVIPAYIWGTPETAEIGPALRTPSHAGVIFGRPIDVSGFVADGAGEGDKAALSALSNRLMDEIVALRDRVMGAEGPGRSRPAPGGDGDGSSDGVRRGVGRAVAVSGDRPAVPTA